MVVMVRPAPLASTPTLPSSSMNLRSRALARASSSVSFSGVPVLASASCRGTALSSIASLQSSATSRPSSVSDQRIDLHQLGVVGGVDGIEPQQQIDQGVAVEAGTGGSARSSALASRPLRMSTAIRTSASGCFGRNLFDIHAALGREQQQRALAAGSLSTAAYISRAIGTCASTSTVSTRCSPMVMPRMLAAAAWASSAVAASLMPPALPRLPVGTCALTTHGPIRAPPLPASSGVRASRPFGVAMPAAAQQRLGRMLLEVHTQASAQYCRISLAEPSDSRRRRRARLVQARIAEPRGEPHRRPGALILGIAAELLVAECAVGSAEEVDAAQAILGLEARQHGPGLVDAPRHSVLTCRTLPSRRRTALPRSACPRGWW